MYFLFLLATDSPSQVQLTELTNTEWDGQLRIGMVSFDPSTLSQILHNDSIHLPPDIWVLSGNTVLHNGEILSENYGRHLSRLQVIM